MVLIRLKSIVDEVFQDYKKPSMMLAACKCDWKCLKELCLDYSICQNSDLAKQKNIDVSVEAVIKRYMNNPITHAVVIGGLEPFSEFCELMDFVHEFRQYTDDDIVIYTGYYPDELDFAIKELKEYKNIIIKFGRFKTDSKKIYDEVLGVWLMSDNQFAQKIS